MSHTMSDTTTATTTHKASLDWTGLHRALVFTKLVYRKPVADKPRPAGAAKSGRPVPSVEQIASVAARATTTPAPVAVAASATPESPYRHVDAYGDTDERLLPWSWD